MTEQPPLRGRPPAASRMLLQDAAFELFLEHGYAATTVEHISRRAGVSRNTFFNYFEAKGDVFWVELDDCIHDLAVELERFSPGQAPLRAVRDAIVAASASLDSSRVPFALTQHELIGSAQELQASAIGRFTSQSKRICNVLVAHSVEEQLARAATFALLGAVIAAAQNWAAAGTARGDLAPHLERATEPVVTGFEPRHKLAR